MKPAGRLALMAVLCLPLLLTGCSLFPTTRKLPVPKAPTINQTISPEDLVERLNKRWGSINTLTAKVEIRPSVTKSKEGIATDYPSVEGHILIRKPGSLRVVGQLIGMSVFDMASDGNCFTVSIPHENRVIKGCGPAKVKSKNPLENLRPGFFFDSMLVRGLESDDRYSVTSETNIVEDPAKKHLFSVPEYILHITRYMTGSQKELTERVVYFHRDDLLPSEQDIYDAGGTLETQVLYANYQDFESGTFPSTVTIKRLPEDIQIVLTVEDVHENQTLPDEQFVVPIPKGSKIELQQ
jgi:outer membrane lipoprotein-sorting protein